MFECRACVLRSLRAIAGDSIRSPNIARRQLLLTPRLANQVTQRHASTATATRSLEDDLDELTPGRQPIAEPINNGEGVKKQQKDSLSSSDEKALNIELRYLGDKVKLAQHIHYTLRDNKPEKALNMCRLASKKQQVIVSWNHCVDWHMQRGKIEEAMKIYNEMKKRAQFPDAYTYTLLLRGLAKPHHHGQPVRESNVTRAVSIYNSMSSPTSRVKPSIYHTNAVLAVCSAALDIDAVWGIISKLPSHGAGAPDATTYTVLLQAIRHGAFGKHPENASVEQITMYKDKAVQEGRAVWRDVIAKWRSGEVHIDEELVCAVAKLLLTSSRMSDWDDVLNLVKQTMNIDRQIPALGDPERHAEHVPQQDQTDLPAPEPESEDADGYIDSPAAKAFFPVRPYPKDSAHPQRPTTLIWVQPGNPTLDVLIEACTVLRTPKTSSAYWALLTSSESYALKPDISNFRAQLRLLSKNRSSAKAVSLILHDMPAAGVEPKNQTFRIAMGCCKRDMKNPHVLEHARSIIDVMERTSADPDMHTLIQYLNLALSTDNGPKIVATLNRLDSVVHNLRSKLTYGPDDEGAQWRIEDRVEDAEETVHFFRTMVGVIDTLMNKGLVAREEYNHWHARRSQLNSFIGRAMNNLEKQRGRMEQTAEGEGRKAFQRETSFRKRSNRRGESGRPMPMSKEEWALKTFRWNERKREAGKLDWLRQAEAAEGARRKAVGLKKWDLDRMRPAQGVGEQGRLAGLANFNGAGRERRVAGLAKWDVGQVNGDGEKRGRKRDRVDGQGVVDTGFADSPMELGMR